MAILTTTYFGWSYWPNLDAGSLNIWGTTMGTFIVALDSDLKTRRVDYDFAGYKLDDAQLIDSSETAYNAGNISGAVTLDYENGHWQYATLTGNVTSLTINNLPASGKGGWMTLELIQDGTGGRTLTLGSAYKTAAAAGITLTTSAGARDFVYLRTRDGGSTIHASADKDYR